MKDKPLSSAEFAAYMGIFACIIFIAGAIMIISGDYRITGMAAIKIAPEEAKDAGITAAYNEQIKDAPAEKSAAARSPAKTLRQRGEMMAELCSVIMICMVAFTFLVAVPLKSSFRAIKWPANLASRIAESMKSMMTVEGRMKRKKMEFLKSAATKEGWADLMINDQRSRLARLKHKKEVNEIFSKREKEEEK